MANHNETFQATIELNSKQAQSRLQELQAEQKRLVEEQKKLYREGTAESKKQAEQMQKDINRVTRDIKDETRHVKGLNAAMQTLSQKTYNDLRNEVRQLNKLMRDGSVEKNSAEWRALAERIKVAKREMRQYEQAVTESQSSWRKFTRFLNDSWGGLTLVLSSLAGITMTVRKSVQDYADMEEAMADTRKYTGLADEGVRQLNERLKQMDTRTGREELNALAGVAGRLGISSQEALLQFVDAADKIKVALGDDLGEGAIDNVGKLAMAFGEDERMGLRGAMLATGSAINEVAQNSSANAGFLVDFTARVAGFGKQLGLTQAQIMGFGAVMDENLLRDEMAATAFGNMLTKMQTDTDKFAKIAGMDLQEFTRLLNEDANQAILRLADSLKQADPQTMMKMLDDMGLDGSRAVAVLATMADKIDDVRRHQERATEAYAEGTSVIKEYDTMNNTVQAQIDKAKNRFHELSVELGQKLMPVVKYTITSASAFLRVLSTLMNFVFKYKELLAVTTVTIVAYTAAVKAKTIATKLSAAASTAAAFATRLFNAALKANPIGLLVAGLTAAVALFVKYRDRIQGGTEAMGFFKEAAKTLLSALAQVTTKMIDAVKWLGSLYDRFAVIRWIVGVVATTFTAGVATIGNGIKFLVNELDGFGKVLQGAFTFDFDKVKEGYKQVMKGIGDVVTDQAGIIQRQIRGMLNVPSPSNNKGSTTNQDAVDEIGEVVVTGTNKKKPQSTTYVSDSDRKKADEERKQRESDAKKAEQERLKRLKDADAKEKAIMDERLAANMLMYRAGEQNYRQFTANQLRIQQEGLEARMAVWQEEPAQYAKLQKQLQALLLNGDEETNRLRLADYELMHQDMMRQLEKDFHTEGSAIYHNEMALEEARFQEQMDYMENRKSLTREGSLERMQIEQEIIDLMHRHQLEQQLSYEQMLQDVKTQYLQHSDDKRKEIELNGLDELHKRGLLKEEEYQRARLAIQAQYANGQTPDEKTASTAADMLKVASSEAAKKASSGTGIPIFGTIAQYSAQMDMLEELYGKDEENHEAYLEAKRQATANFCRDLGQQMQTAFQSINQVMSAASSYYGAQQDYELAVTKKKYEKQIEAAGNNQKRVKKIQEKQAKEEAAIKTKYNRKQVKIQIAQALAQTAINALNAYGSAAAIPVVGNILAPIAAAMAVAAGMLQVAAIKKQAQAQEAGYYEGGFTGGRRYRREAGVVHEGEFVANHEAVNNPNVLPMLQFLDQAQRNNTVGRISSEDVARIAGAGQGAVVAPVVNVQSDNEELRQELADLRETNQQLRQQLEDGIGVDFPMDSFDRNYRHYQRLKNRG